VLIDPFVYGESILDELAYAVRPAARCRVDVPRRGRGGVAAAHRTGTGPRLRPCRTSARIRHRCSPRAG